MIVVPAEFPVLFNAIKLSPARFGQLKASVPTFPRTHVGKVGDVDLYTDPLVPDDIAVLMRGREVVGVIRLGPKPGP